MNWYFEVLKKYAVFTGRARRQEYWDFVLFNILISVLSGFVDGVIGTHSTDYNIGVLSEIYVLAVLVPSIAVGVRRLHDTNHSGWWLLIGLIPIIGAIVLLVFLVEDSQPGENRYGPNPKGCDSDNSQSMLPSVCPYCNAEGSIVKNTWGDYVCSQCRKKL